MVHSHDWHVPEYDGAFYYEDGALFIEEECCYTEERVAGHSERLDETFYETMFDCDARRKHRFDLTGVEVVYDADRGSRLRRDDTDATEIVAEGADVFEISDAYEPSFIERIDSEASERLTEGYEDDPHPLAVEWFDYSGVNIGPHFVEIEVDGQLYRLRYEKSKTYRV